MVIWHDTEDAQRIPAEVFQNDKVVMWIGSYPVEPGQAIVVEVEISNGTNGPSKSRVEAEWKYNDYTRNNSYWAAIVGPFTNGEKINYKIIGKGFDHVEHVQVGSFKVLPRGQQDTN